MTQHVSVSDKFTFYGDLLGIATAYNLGATIAYRKLNDFYNIVFHHLEPICIENPGKISVQMFSDSVVIWGEGTLLIMTCLLDIYPELLRHNLLLRGALVDGALEKEPRIEIADFRKFLPANDTLARAVGLEKTVKGARLLIESSVATRLLADRQSWLTVESYNDDLCPAIPLGSPLRRICPLPSGTSYELLYFWERDNGLDKKFDKKFRDTAEFYEPAVVEHFRETMGVFKRSQHRKKSTEIDFQDAVVDPPQEAI